MNKTLLLACAIASASALQLKSFTREQLLNLAEKEGVSVDEHPDLGPSDINGNAQENKDKKTKLAQAGQYVHQCDETFTRLAPDTYPDAAALQAAGTEWTDPDYSQDQAMYGKSYAVTWSRMSDYFPASSGYSLFENDAKVSIEINDTLQGYLGDCWVLAFIASMAEHPDRIWNMFDQKAYNESGVYSIRMYEMGAPISVVIDEFLPVYTPWGDNMFAWVNYQKEMWPILIEKAFSKLMGNYRTIEGGWPTDAGMAFMGTPSYWKSSSSYTSDALHALVTAEDNANSVMWCATSSSMNGIIGGHAYSLIDAHTLLNGVKLLRIRNPWGNSEWTGQWSDADFAATKSQFASEVGFVSKNDGDFFMTVDDFKIHFPQFGWTVGAEGLHHANFLHLEESATTQIGEAGTTSYCGPTCTLVKFQVTSNVAQTVYVIPAVHYKRQYVEAPCTDAAQSTESPIKYMYTSMPGQSRIWHHGHTSYNPYNMSAGQTITVKMEMDLARPGIQKDFALNVWGTSEAVTIEVAGEQSHEYYQFGASGNTTPEPAPVVLEDCDAFNSVIAYSRNSDMLVLSNACLTRDATFTVTTDFTKVQSSVNHDSATCTGNTCTYVVTPGGSTNSVLLQMQQQWDGVYTSSVVLSQ